MVTIDLNAEKAARREQSLEGLRVVLGNDEFMLPPELPLDVFSPFRDIVGDDDLPQLVQTLVDDATEQALQNWIKTRPAIAVEAFDALRFAMGRLFCSAAEGCDLEAEDEETRKPAPMHGPECQWPRFQKQRPSLPDYLALGRGLLAGYGVSLGEARGPSDSSGDGGPTSKPTSKRTTKSTPAKRSQSPARRASSA